MQSAPAAPPLLQVGGGGALCYFLEKNFLKKNKGVIYLFLGKKRVGVVS